MESMQDAINRLLKKGLLWTEIGATFGVSERQARRWWRGEGDPPSEVAMPSTLDCQTAFITSDHHYPHQHPGLVSLQCRILNDLRPEVVVHLGDAWDFAQLSSYDHDPTTEFSFQEDLVAGEGVILKRLKNASKDSKFVFLCGNHESRIIRYILGGAPALMSRIKAAEGGLQSFMSLDWVDEFRPYRSPYYLSPNIVCIHGSYALQGPGSSAAKSQRIHYPGRTVIQGHTHKMACLYQANGWVVEIGHAASEEAVPKAGEPNSWRLSAGCVVTWKGDRLPTLEMLPLIDNGVHFRGKFYSLSNT